MGFPRKLKDMNLFNEGASFLSEVESVTLPPLRLLTEDWRGGGMMAAVKIVMGMEAGEMEWALGGPNRLVLNQYGVMDIGGVFLRFAGAYQDDSTGTFSAVEVTVRGRHTEIDMGEQKIGEAGSFKVKTAWVYYRLDWDGATVIEIDLLAGIFMVNGVDRMAEIRSIIR